MMAWVEVGAALARKTVGLEKAADGETAKFKAMARIFAGEVAQLVGEKALRVVSGTGAADQGAVDAFLAEIGYQELLGARRNWVADMDQVADIIFER
jgi:alkylation response protein AidB-like acyl-CoA dehydrogenase